MYHIMYSHEGQQAEEVDTADTEDEAQELLCEYALAFGCYTEAKSKVWIRQTYHRMTMSKDADNE